MSLVGKSGGFVGRVRELEALCSLVDSVEDRSGAIAFVAGEPGIGKSSLINQVRRRARERGFSEIVGFCVEDEGAPPYWPWVQGIRGYIDQRSDAELKHQLGADASYIAEIVPEVRLRLPEIPVLPTDSDSERAQFRLFDAIGQSLKRAGRSSPVLVVLEDLHTADESSLRMLSFLSRQLDGLRVLILASFRDIEVRAGHRLFRVLGELTGHPRIERLSLAGWELDDTRAYLELAFPAGLPSDLVDEVHRQSDGTPMFVVELAKLIPEDGGDTGTERADWFGRLPDGIGEVVGRRLGRLSSHTYSMLSLAAVVGSSFSLTFLEFASGEKSTYESLDEAEGLGIIDPVEERPGEYTFLHDLFRRALLEGLTATTRSRRHAEIAAAIERRIEEYSDHNSSEGAAAAVAVGAAVLATHLHKAGGFADSAKLIRYAKLAGDHALSVYAYEEARSYFSLALDTIGREAETPEAAELWYGVGRSCIPMDRYDDHEAPLGRAFELCERLDLADLGVRVALALDHHSKLLHIKRRAMEMTDAVCADRAVLLSQVALQITFLGESVEEAHRCIEEARRLAELIGDPGLSAYAVRAHARVEYNHGEWDEALELAEEAVKLSNRVGDNRLCAEAYVRIGMVYLNSTEPRRSLEAGSRAMERAKRSGDRWVLFWALLLQSECLAEFGELDQARTVSEEAFAISPTFFNALGDRVELEAHSGDTELGNRFLDLFLEVTRSEKFLGGVPDWKVVDSLSMWIFLTGETEHLERAEQSVRTVFTDGVAGPTARWLAFPGVARLLVMRGDRVDGERWYDRMRSDYGNRFGFDHVLGMAACAAGNRPHAIHCLETAWLSSSESGRVLVQLESGYHLAGLYLSDPATAGGAPEIVAVALHEARRRGMRLWIAKFEALTRVDSPERSPNGRASGLSEREIEVIRLVADGLTDREVGERLFISPKTVSNHLTNIRAKLGCRNRAEIIRSATEHGILPRFVADS